MMSEALLECAYLKQALANTSRRATVSMRNTSMLTFNTGDLVFCVHTDLQRFLTPMPTAHYVGIVIGARAMSGEFMLVRI